jgi:hypothetical protein
MRVRAGRPARLGSPRSPPAEREVPPVSAFEPQLPSEPKVDLPDFMVVLRGYDRRQVEMWAAEVANQIEQERLRADEAEKQAYRVQIENKGSASFSHLGSHVASILEEAGRSSENMLADAAERAQETVDAAEGEAAEIIKAAEHRVGEIEQEARQTLEDARAEGARVEEDALQAAEEMRAQAEQDARTVLEEARDATDLIWQEAERERVTVEAETIRLETLRHRSLEQLGRVYGHLESVLDEVRAGIGRVEEEEDEATAAAAAAARLGVEPPAATGEAPAQFPSPHDPAGFSADGDGDGDDDAGFSADDDDDGEAAAGDGLLAATRPDTPVPDEAGLPEQPALPGAADAEATQPVTEDAAEPSPVAEADTEQAANGEGQDATQRLEPVGGKPRQSEPSPNATEDQS